jgi:hypothetical protein
MRKRRRHSQFIEDQNLYIFCESGYHYLITRIQLIHFSFIHSFFLNQLVIGLMVEIIK